MIHPILRILTKLPVVHPNDDLVALPTFTLRVLPAEEEEHDVRCDEAAADVEDDDAVSEEKGIPRSGAETSDGLLWAVGTMGMSYPMLALMEIPPTKC